MGRGGYEADAAVALAQGLQIAPNHQQPRILTLDRLGQERRGLVRGGIYYFDHPPLTYHNHATLCHLMPLNMYIIALTCHQHVTPFH